MISQEEKRQFLDKMKSEIDKYIQELDEEAKRRSNTIEDLIADFNEILNKNIGVPDNYSKGVEEAHLQYDTKVRKVFEDLNDEYEQDLRLTSIDDDERFLTIIEGLKDKGIEFGQNYKNNFKNTYNQNIPSLMSGVIRGLENIPMLEKTMDQCIEKHQVLLAESLRLENDNSRHLDTQFKDRAESIIDECRHLVALKKEAKVDLRVSPNFEKTTNKSKNSELIEALGIIEKDASGHYMFALNKKLGSDTHENGVTLTLVQELNAGGESKPAIALSEGVKKYLESGILEKDVIDDFSCVSCKNPPAYIIYTEKEYELDIYKKGNISEINELIEDNISKLKVKIQNIEEFRKSTKIEPSNLLESLGVIGKDESDNDKFMMKEDLGRFRQKNSVTLTRVQMLGEGENPKPAIALSDGVRKYLSSEKLDRDIMNDFCCISCGNPPSYIFYTKDEYDKAMKGNEVDERSDKKPSQEIE